MGDIFACVVSKMKVQEWSYVSEFHSFVNDMRGFFAELDNSFQIVEEYFLKTFVLFIR